MSARFSCRQWYAVQVKTRWEGSTAALLGGKGYQTFLPTHLVEKLWGRGASKGTLAPLFPGYVFCQFDPSVRLPILVTPGVIAVVGTGRVPVPVEDSEIETIQRVVSSGLQAKPWPYLEVGEQVRIQGGPLRGLQGILTSFKGVSRVVVSISLLSRSVAVEIDRLSVCAIRAVAPDLLRPISLSPLLEGIAT